MSTLLELFTDFSGLQINRTKSAYIGFRLAQEKEFYCSKALGTPIRSLPMRYLGLSLTWTKMTKTNWQPVVEKLERRLEGWQTKVVSWGRRLMRLQSVLSVIPLFYLSVFKMPVGVRKQILRYDEVFPMERPRTRTELMLGDDFVGGHLSTY